MAYVKSGFVTGVPPQPQSLSNTNLAFGYAAPLGTRAVNGNITINNNMSSSSDVIFPGSVKFEGDIEWKGRELGRLIESIEDRLAILTEPNQKKLEKFAALKKAYDHYKLMEKLIGEDD
jgi:hypothetical protein